MTNGDFQEWAGNGQVIFSSFTATLGERRGRQNNPPPLSAPDEIFMRDTPQRQC